MVDGIRTKPTPEVRRERGYQSEVGMFFKGLHDAEPPEEGVTRFGVRPKKPPKNYRWRKNVMRYVYRAGAVNEAGKRIGGKFMKTPPDAPPIWKRQ